MTELDLDYTSPTPFTAKQKRILAVAPPLASAYLRAACSTNRRRDLHTERMTALRERSPRVLIAFFHEVLGLAAYVYRDTGSHTLTSYSFDGELAAQVVRWCGLRALRGSSSKGGYKALKDLAKATRAVDVVGFTIDGPRGPRRIAKPGIAILSAKTGIPVIPHALAVTRSWRMRSWDRLVVPKPFGTLISAFGEPIEAPARMNSTSVEAMRVEIETRLNTLQAAIEEEHGIDARLESSQ